MMASVCAEVRDGLGKNVITADGNLLGRVEELLLMRKPVSC